MRDLQLPQTVTVAIEGANVPPLPQVLLRLIQQLDDESSTIESLAAIVSKDPALSARILTAANSAAFYRSTPASDIKACVSLLGTRMVRSMATCLAVKRLFDADARTVSVDLTDFWRHSLLVAETSRAMASATGYPNPGEAFLAGLLHDVGQLVLMSALGEQYAWLLSQTGDEDKLIELERTSLSTDHCEVGTWLADQWRLDSGLADALLFHHASADEIATASNLPRLVWFADALARGVQGLAPFEELAATLFGTDSGFDAGRILTRALDHVQVIATAMGVAARPEADDISPQRTLPNVTVLTATKAPHEADRALAERICDMAVMHPLQQDLFELASETELLNALRESARILFELPHMGFLLIDRESGELTGGEIAGQAAIFRQTRVPRGTDAGLATQAIAEREVRSSFDDVRPPRESLLDRQLARAFDSEGILAVPMVGKRRTVGVMLFALGRVDHGRLKRRTPWLLNFGRIGGVSVEAWQDATASRKQAEDEAAAAFRRQARRIVHEVGNPLGIIKSYLRILDQRLPENSDVRHEIDVLRDEIDRVAGIVRRMNEVPTPAGAATSVAVTALVRELLALYGAPLFGDKGIAVTSRLGDDADRAACDPDSLKQILVNLWKNAAEATPRGGRFEISVLDGVVQNGRRHVEIRMEDSGAGMPDEAIRNLSFPDQAHSSADRGHGLSIVGSIAARIGCRITCRSKAGVGTTLSLLLPCVQVS
ncbi:HDOD domain-containing protein [Aromatoleum toluolicum]|uniref:histidine kinase n=1 Tax=Aromatoleum toluolicum TaxID=90060 RepID=A0ABX1NME7_9RHOO|nr:HDOD domain-containing protein [Aromatoleum toluolicum]NMG00534.1 HDOD domain-containing protein [Aromatoleum toluolicum]